MKPNVICLMASNVDGRTLPSRWRPKGSAGNLFERVHDELAGDAWLVGRVTGQEFAKGKPYPVAIAKSGKEGGKVNFERWNERFTITPPANAIDISQLRSGK